MTKRTKTTKRTKMWAKTPKTMNLRLKLLIVGQIPCHCVLSLVRLEEWSVRSFDAFLPGEQGEWLAEAGVVKKGGVEISGDGGSWDTVSTVDVEA